MLFCRLWPLDRPIIYGAIKVEDKGGADAGPLDHRYGSQGPVRCLSGFGAWRQLALARAAGASARIEAAFCGGRSTA
jgi:hypothetical protein